MSLQDITKCLLGSPQSSFRKGTEDFASDPATYLAGLAVRRNSSNLLSVIKADGMWAGISLGQSLSSTKNTTVLKGGDMVPVILQGTVGRQITITSYANLVATSNDTLKLGATTFTFKASPSTESEVGAVTSNTQTAINLATKINAHSVAGLVFEATNPTPGVVLVTLINDNTDGSTVDCVYTDAHPTSVGLTVDGGAITFAGTESPDYVVLGANVYFSDTSGKADDPESVSTVSNAIYASGVLKGIQEDGTQVYAAYINMVGGL